MRRRAPIFTAALAVITLGFTACSGSERPDAEETEPPPDSSTTAPATTTTAAEVVGIDAAAGLGDDLFPGLGNAGYDVQHYELDLTVDPNSPQLRGLTQFLAIATEDLRSFTLDLHAMRVARVVVNGSTASVERDGDELRVSPAQPIAAGAKFFVRVRYRGIPRLIEGAGDFGLGWVRTATGTYTLSEPGSAHAWFPGNDHLSDKATYGITVTTAATTDVVANGSLVSDDPVGADRHVVRYEMREPMATYLVQVATGDFTFTDPVTTESGVVVQHVVDSDAADRLVPSMQKVPAMIEFFEERFGPYPFDRYGTLITRAIPGLALETQTLSIFDVSDLAPETPPDDPSAEFFADVFLAHELAHQWFGDAVTPEQWIDIWLNEGFASYAQYVWAETDSPGLLAGYMPQAHADITSDRATFGTAGEPTAESLFGPAVYDGAAVVLHALRLEVGDENFFTILEQWVERFGGGNASTADFVALASEISDRDLAEFFDGWLYATPAPPYPTNPAGQAGPTEPEEEQ